MSGWFAAQAALYVAAVVRSVRWLEAGVDLEPIAAASRVVSVEALVRALGVIEDDEPLEVAWEQRLVELRRRLTVGAGEARAWGLIATLLGIAAIGRQIVWIGEDHGLADLAPDRILRVATSRAVEAFFVALATSATLFVVRGWLLQRARRQLDALRRFDDIVRARWTDSHEG